MNPEAARASGLDTALPTLAALERRVSLRALLIALAAVFFLIAWNRGIALLYGSFALLLATIAVAWLAPRLNLAGLEVSRRYPREGRVGETLRLSLTLATRGWPWRYMLEIEERLPFAPGGTPRLFLPNVGRESRIDYEAPCLLRGRYRLGQIGIASGFPLGVARASRVLEPAAPARRPALTIYPRTLPVGAFVMQAAAGGDGSRPAAARGRDLFREVRPYRTGDNVRDVHWRASARTGELLVKEFDQVDAHELLLVLDLDMRVHAGEGPRHTLEYAVEICASLAASAIARGQAVGLAGGLAPGGLPALWIPPARGARHLRSLLEALVDVRADSTAAYAAALKALAATGCRARTVLFRHTLSPLPGAAGSLVFEFDADSFEPEAPPPRQGFRRGRRFHVTAATDLAALLA